MYIAVGLFLIVGLMQIVSKEILHSRSYSDSFMHNLVKQNTGIHELQEFKRAYKIDESKNIFTPANSEVAYYLENRTIWDYRLFFISEAEISRYLKLYNVEYLIIPNSYLNAFIYVNGNQELNDSSNWINTSIPNNSNFKTFLNDSSKVSKIRKYEVFTVYRINQ
jgi:hypothetical protein